MRQGNIQGNEISFLTWDFKVCPKIFLRFLRFCPRLIHFTLPCPVSMTTLFHNNLFLNNVRRVNHFLLFFDTMTHSCKRAIVKLWYEKVFIKRHLFSRFMCGVNQANKNIYDQLSSINLKFDNEMSVFNQILLLKVFRNLHYSYQKYLFS